MRKLLAFITVIIGVLIFVGCTAADTIKSVSTDTSKPEVTETVMDDLYSDACDDAMVAESDEIEPVIVITKDSKDVIWNESGDRVLMLTYHWEPEAYPENETVILGAGQVWVTSAREMIDWYKANNNGVADWTLRLKQLLGLPHYDTYTHMTAMWVSPEDMFRPAYVTDITSGDMTNKFTDESDGDYKEWFDDNIIGSYYDGDYPWTRLGYTYDWADNGTEKGLSEFIVDRDSAVSVEFTKTTEDFIKWLNEQK